jgi:spoIIIJ-associated protein
MTNGIEDSVLTDEVANVPDAQADGEQDESPRAEGGARHGNSRRRHQHGHNHNDEQAFYQGDTRAHDALHFTSTVLQQMGMDCRARLRRPREAAPEGQPPEIVIEVYGRDSGRIIGKRGQVLAALQFLTHRAVNRPDLERRHVVVDAEGYRLRRESTLANMARRLGQQAVDEGKIITFEPMNPRDRRVVHLALAKFDGVITKSEGEGEERRVQIIPVRR